MLRTTKVELPVEDLRLVGGNGIIDGIGNASKLGGAKPGVNSCAKSSTKSKNMIKLFMIKSQSLVKPSFRSGFPTLRAWLVFVK